MHSKLRTAWAILLAGVCTLSGTTRADDVVVHEGIVYGLGGEERMELDLILPKNAKEPVPLLIYIHGGGWKFGNRKDVLTEAKRAAGHGYAAATVSYRLSTKAPFPAQVEDVRCAVRYLRATAPDWGIDPKRFGAIGFSAGAHLAMMLGVMDMDDGLDGGGGWFGHGTQVQAVVSYVGPTDLLGEYPPASQGLVKDFIGGAKNEKREAYTKASPITYVTADDAPMLFFQGTSDELVPWDQTVRMAEALTKAGVQGRVELCLGQNHGLQRSDMNNAQELERTRKATDEFFAIHLKHTPAKN